MKFDRVIRLMGAAVVVLAMSLFSGCDGSDDGGSGGSGVVGKWVMVSGESGSSGYWEFFNDGSFVMFDDSAYSVAHASGTYAQSGNVVTGTFENPGVGTGEIDCTLSADNTTMTMDFIEHWHSPYKHVPFTGTKQ